MEKDRGGVSTIKLLPLDGRGPAEGMLVLICVAPRPICGAGGLLWAGQQHGIPSPCGQECGALRAEAARHMGSTTSTVARAARAEELDPTSRPRNPIETERPM